MTPADRAQLALLLEVAGTPKPGNVDRAREYPDLRFEQFLAGAVGAGAGLRAAAWGGGDAPPVGEAFETAVEGMAAAAGTNTQFGALLLLVPLVRTAGTGPLTRSRAAGIADGTTVDDAVAFYRALDHVDVAVNDPPPGADDLDARRGSDAIPAVEERGLALGEVLELGADADGVAAEWVEGFPRSFAVSERVADDEGPLADRAARAFLAELARVPDTLVARRHGEDVAAEVAERAADLLDADAGRVAAFADELVERGVNPGTTADVVASGLFVALERGVSA